VVESGERFVPKIPGDRPVQIAPLIHFLSTSEPRPCPFDRDVSKGFRLNSCLMAPLCVWNQGHRPRKWNWVEMTQAPKTHLMGFGGEVIGLLLIIRERNHEAKRKNG